MNEEKEQDEDVICFKLFIRR